MELLQGTEVPLNHQLHDGDESLFVLAWVTDVDKNPIPESPIEMEHGFKGKYFPKEAQKLSMPNSKFLYVTYRAYLDAAYSVDSDVHGDGKDTFKLKVDEVRRFLTSDTVLIGELESDPELVGEIEETPQIVGEITSSNIIGEIEVEDELEGEASSSDITGHLKDCE